MEFVFMLAFIAAIVLAFFGWESHQKKRWRASWSELAADYGLEFDPDGETLSGEIDGIDVSAYLIVRGSSQHKSTYTVFDSVLTDTIPVGLEIRRQGMLANFGKMVGMEDNEVDDPAFDERFVVKTPFPEDVPKFFGPRERRRALVDLARIYSNTRIDDSRLQFELGGRVHNQAQMRAAIDSLIECARRLSSATEVEMEAEVEEVSLDFSEQEVASADEKITDWGPPEEPAPTSEAHVEDDEVLW